MVPSLGPPVQALFQWAETRQDLLAWFAALSGLMFVSSLIVIPVLLTRMRADYFVTPDPDEGTWLGRHPAARTTARVVKNSVGIVLLMAGLSMLVLPGQGIITLLVALSLLEFPGKRRLELRLVQTRGKGTLLRFTINGDEFSAEFGGSANHIWNVTAP